MGYSDNEGAIKRVQPLLDQMLGVEGNNSLAWKAENPHMLAYHIREAMHVAKKIGKAPYHELKDGWIIRNRGDRVIAEKREVETLQALQQVMDKMELGSLRTVMEVVGAAIIHKAAHMFFPDAILDDDEKLQLYTWSSKNGYHIIVAEVGVTLVREDPGEVAWTP